MPAEVDGRPWRTLRECLLAVGHVGRRWRSHSELRGAAIHQAAIFATFTAAWSTVAWALRELLGCGSSTYAGMSLVAVAPILLVPLSGRAIDRWGPHPVGWLVVIADVIAAGLLSGAYLGGSYGLLLLIAGVLVLDTATQIGSVANSVRVQRIDPSARGALTSTHMTVQFLSGGLGSLAAAWSYSELGWAGVCSLIAALASVAAAALCLNKEGRAPLTTAPLHRGRRTLLADPLPCRLR
jgi:predicted MFS family arabinose efflux permease